MRGSRRGRVLAVAAALAVTALGLTGAYAYASNYDIHRGFDAVPLAKGAGSSRLLTERFYSRAMHKRVYYLVDLPPGYSRSRHYPVYYLLHGEPGRPRGFIDVASMGTRMADLVHDHRARPMILVFPNGEIGRSYYSDSEWANTPSGDFQSYVIEVMREVDDHFSTIRDRDGRVLGGFSMGAYGAMNIGLHHVDDFADIQAWSGYYIETHDGVFAHASRATMAYDSPGEYVTHLRAQIHRDPLDVFMYVGDHDSDAAQQAPMARALRQAGAHVADRIYPGGHNWDMWWPRLDPMIQLAAYDTGHPPARTRLGSGQITPVPTRLGVVAGGRHHHRSDHRGRRRRSGSAPTRGRRAVHHVAIVTRSRGGSQARRLEVVMAPSPRSRHPTLRLIGALLLALAASALINLGFVLQHRAHAQTRRRGEERLRHVFLSPLWLLGQLIGWAGWAGQIVAVALVPLTLVQAVGAGSLALSVPLAAWLFDYRISRGQLGAIAAIAAALASLPVGAGTHGDLSNGLLIGLALLLSLVCATGCVSRTTAVRATSAGVLYGVADAAVKADSIALRHHGLPGLLSGWTIVAALATFGGFLAFQAALRGRDAVQPLSLMAASSAVTGVVIGVAAFREPLGSSVGLSIVHVAAIVVVLACVPPLVRAQQRLAGNEPVVAVRDDAPASAPAGALPLGPGGEPSPEPWRRRPLGVALALGARFGAVIAAVIAGLAGVGLLFGLRGLDLIGWGPRVPDGLPLLALAGHSGQPLLRLLVAFLLAGLALGVALARVAPSSRMLFVAPVAALLLLVGSDASYALTNNLAFLPVLAHREPALGPWLEWLVLAGSAALPGVRSAAREPVSRDSMGPRVKPMSA